MKGLVISASRNIFMVKPDVPQPGKKGVETVKTNVTCRIKGKVLKGVEPYDKPLAPGDRVSFDQEPGHQGFIRELKTRRNLFSRFNRQSQSSQLLAANVDLALCVTTPVSPPFRPRFLDRILMQADSVGIPLVIVCNKQDLYRGEGTDIDIEERLQDWSRIGYPVLRVSARTGEGMDELRSHIAHRFSVLLGQSGVGKSSLIKALVPDLAIRVGSLNEKYDRGNHTTTMSVLLEIPRLGEGTGIIDTPGMRRFVPDRIEAAEVLFYMREFAPLAGKCTYGLSCSHRTEPGCKILEAVSSGVIHEDRYESFLRIQDELSGMLKIR
ncbi:MAG: ribosome small subunit-dependent GTPase A [Treponema sp.]|jgi:ribosome biogenesis GTPase|nr:ribosome small subunit-dependent GTPase A [Treponema sp.]